MDSLSDQRRQRAPKQGRDAFALLNLVEEVPQFVIQFLYSWYNEDETTSVEWASLATTSISLLYVITQKLLAFYCLDENPIKLIEEPYQTWYRSNDLKRFLRDIEEFPSVCTRKQSS